MRRQGWKSWEGWSTVAGCGKLVNPPAPDRCGAAAAVGRPREDARGSVASIARKAGIAAAHLIGMATPPRLCSSSSSLKSSSPSYSGSQLGSSVLAGEHESSWRRRRPGPGLGGVPLLLATLLAGDTAILKPTVVTRGLLGLDIGRLVKCGAAVQG